MPARVTSGNLTALRPAQDTVDRDHAPPPDVAALARAASPGPSAGSARTRRRAGPPDLLA
jgi:hypothetical protein